MNDLRSGLNRLSRSSVLWSWAMNGFRLASALLLLPLLLVKLPTAEFGMYYLFLQLYALIPIIDFGFSVSVGRYVSYAMGGAQELKPLGLDDREAGAAPNVTLLWRLLKTTRQLFAFMALAALVMIGVVGTWAVGLRVEETACPSFTWLAWGVTLGSAVWEVYAGWWNVFLRGMNQVLLGARISVVAYVVKLGLACLLLLFGAGLLAVPLAGLVSSFLQRALSRRYCLRHLGAPPRDLPAEVESLFRVLWPTSWRVGLQFLSSYLVTHANGLICIKYFGLSANAAYGLSMQIAMMIQGMASVWTLVKWPLVGQYRARNDLAGLRRVLWARVWLQSLTFLVLAVAAYVLGPPLLQWHGSGKALLAPTLFGLLLLMAFLETQFTFWTTLLSTENRVPSLWPTVVSNVACLILILVLVSRTALGLPVLVVTPLAVGALFSYWYWPLRGAHSLGTAWWRYTFLGPEHPGRKRH